MKNLGDPGFRTPRIFRRPELPRAEWQVWRWSEMRNWYRLHCTRLTVLRTPWFRIMVHRYHSPDPTTALHNHWSWLLSFVLWGNYIEERKVTGRLVRRVIRYYNWIPQRVFHRVVKPKRGTITLVITGPNKHQIEYA